MGLQIGQTAANLSASPVRSAPPSVASRPDVQSIAPEPRPESVRVGFGEDTLSLYGAAVRTFDANLEQTRELVPSPEEVREELQARRQQEQQQAQLGAGDENPSSKGATVTARPEPAPQAREFASTNAEQPAAPSIPEAPMGAPESAVTPARLDILV